MKTKSAVNTTNSIKAGATGKQGKIFLIMLKWIPCVVENSVLNFVTNINFLSNVRSQDIYRAKNVFFFLNTMNENTCAF